MKLLAHLTNYHSVRKEQSLKEHCLQTASYAAGSIGSTELYHTIYLAGILHDAGKAKEEFVNYLEDAYQGKPVKRGTVNHTFAGVIWLFEKYHTETSTQWERLSCEIIGYAIGAHHGMFDCTDLDGKNGFLHRLQKDREELCYEETICNYFSEVVEASSLEEHFAKAVDEIRELFESFKDIYGARAGGKIFFQVSMVTRIVLSAVIYGDRRDTSIFMSMQKPQQKLPDWKQMKQFFEEKISRFDSGGPLNQTRCEISSQCLKSAEKPSGIFRLNVPTGAGKTLCTLRYALAHAEKYGKKRIIFVIPLLSVLDQNAKVIRDYVPDDADVLEHHSNVIREISKGEEIDPMEFLAESWNYPIVVSTMVQLLNILFSSQTSAAGRMQALCDSVIVIDEVQSLPKKATVMFNMAMNFLQQCCHASIILSSATQPCFEELQWPLHFSQEPDLVQLNPEQLQVFKRAEIFNRIDAYGMDWEQCTKFCREQMEQHASLLVICNTKAEAKILYEKLQEYAEHENWDIFHLSTAMCQAHRMQKLQNLTENLRRVQESVQNRQPVRKQICISTQLIEAGVDLSFECVIRVLAGIDNLAQAAGRCNRSNEYGRLGNVYFINLKSENLSMLREIQSAQNSTRKVLAGWDETKESLIGEQSARNFYRYLFEETKSETKYPVKDCGTTIYLTDLLSNYNGSAENSENKSFILHQPFETVGKKFQVFDQDTVDVVAPFELGIHLIEQMESMDERHLDWERLKEIVQQAKKYTVSVYKWQKEKLDQAGMLYSILDGRILVLDGKAYDPELGLAISDEQPVENYIL